VIFLVILLLKVLRFRSFGWVSVPVTIALFVVLIRYTSVSVQVVIAYCMTWVLLLSGVRMAMQHGTTPSYGHNQPRVRFHDSSVRTLTARRGIRQTTLPLAVSRRRKLGWQPLSVSSGVVTLAERAVVPRSGP